MTGARYVPRDLPTVPDGLASERRAELAREEAAAQERIHAHLRETTAALERARASASLVIRRVSR